MLLPQLYLRPGCDRVILSIQEPLPDLLVLDAQQYLWQHFGRKPLTIRIQAQMKAVFNLWLEERVRDGRLLRVDQEWRYSRSRLP